MSRPQQAEVVAWVAEDQQLLLKAAPSVAAIVLPNPEVDALVRKSAQLHAAHMAWRAASGNLHEAPRACDMLDPTVLNDLYDSAVSILIEISMHASTDV